MADKNKTFIAFILDRSGSMEDLKESVIKGFNEFMKEQRNAAGEALTTIVLFDDRYELLCDKQDIKNVADLTAETFTPRGTTALYDAIGKTILDVKDYISKMEEDDRPGKVLFIITTDGKENASTDFNTKKIADMVKFQREVDSWEFMFTAADEGAVTTAIEINIPKGNTLQYTTTDSGYVNMYASLNSATTNYRCMVGNNNSTLLRSEEDDDSK